MSQAFVKEEDSQWLHDISPTVNALIVYLSKENNGIRVYTRSVSIHSKTGNEIHHMSNGLSYTKDTNGKWMMSE